MKVQLLGRLVSLHVEKLPDNLKLGITDLQNDKQLPSKAAAAESFWPVFRRFSFRILSGDIKYPDWGICIFLSCSRKMVDHYL
jgi:hypothetical protein